MAESVIKEIKQHENDHQTALNDSYNELAESTFKGLRRALPVTKTKVDWNKILNYKLGNAISR